jgi:hypothetical protein
MYVGDKRSRQIRAAENQSLFRDINDRIREGSEQTTGLAVIDGWLCECANEACFEHVHLAPEEYDRVRVNGTRFIVSPDEEHVFPEAESVVDRHERYWVVEKIEAAGREAERLAE